MRSLTSNVLSIIVPMLPDEHGLFADLVEDLLAAPFGFELLVSSPQSFAEFHASLSDRCLQNFNRLLMKKNMAFQFVTAPRSRAKQMNQAAARANAEFLWFVHVDSRLSPALLEELATVLSRSSAAEAYGFYFPLQITGKGFRYACISFWAGLRARVLGMVYGDQALLLPRSWFVALDAYDESLAYGEDHDLLWRARLQGLKWLELRSSLRSSGRAYERKDWWRFCLRRIGMGLRQSLPYQWRYMFSQALPRTLALTPNQQAREQQSSISCFEPTSTTAIVVFVKTPGLSPLKTRLAKTIGQSQAESFHILSCRKLEALLQQAKMQLGVQAFWAVAELEALNHPLWSSFPRLLQSSGGLGERLAHMYSLLKRDFDRVVFLGADTPQLQISDLAQALERLNEGFDFHLGFAEDGGYYLFAGRSEIPHSLWLSITYSVPETGAAFARALRTLGRLSEASHKYRDVDTQEDYQEVAPRMYSDL